MLEESADKVKMILTGELFRTHLFNRIRDMGFEVYRVGDCLEARGAKDAILEGARIGSIV